MVGCGKTVAAAKWILDYASSREVWKMERLRDIDDVTNGYKFKFLGNAVWASSAALARVDHYDPQAVAIYANCDRLVIDDLGVEYMDAKGFYLSLLNELVDKRYAAQLATVMTTNCNLVDFRARYREKSDEGENGRILDRVKETGRFFGCGTESLRKRPEEAQQLPLTNSTAGGQ